MSETITLISEFERWAHLQPHRIAVAHRGQRWSYEVLLARAHEIAMSLIGRGVTPFSHVGIFLSPSMEWIATALAILKAGAAYVPIDRSAPDEHVRFLAADANLRWIVTDSIQFEKDWFLPIDRLRYPDEKVPSGAQFTNVGRRASAYVIYTSGSSGRPKGVVCSHHNVLRLITSTDPIFSFSPADCWTLFHSVAFDFSVWEIFGSLLHGGTLVIVDPETARDPARFAQLLIEEGVTVLNQTPSAWRNLLRTAHSRGIDCFSALRWVIFGGERFQVDSLRSWFERDRRTGPRLINMYGITETTVHVTHREIVSEDIRRCTGSSPVGVAIGDLTVHLLNERLEPVAPGEAGELCVSGPGVANGYLNQPRLTAERFVPNPFDDGERPVLYRSGDLARQTAEGDLCYLGRLDRQVKVRGYRIEPGEIESVLLQTPDVEAVHVTAIHSGTSDARLVAYVIPRGSVAQSSGSEIQLARRLRTFLLTALPAHMIPHVQIVAALPLTANGKVDERGLVAQVASTVRSTESLPDAIEQKVHRIWLEVLKLPDVDRDAGLVDLGAHSLAIALIALRLYEEFRIEISINEFRDNVSVAQIADRIRLSLPSAVTPGRDAAAPSAAKGCHHG